MSVAYKYVADAAVLSFFADCTKTERGELMRVFDRLAESPHHHGAWVQRIPTSRDLYRKRLGKWLVTYWPDDAVCELRIVTVEKVLA